MAQGIYNFMIEWATGGISDDKFAGIKNSFQDIQNIEIRKNPKSIKLQRQMVKDSWGIVVDLINCEVTISTNWVIVAFGNQWNIYVKSLWGSRQKVYTMSGGSAIIWAAEYNSYIYFATLDKLHRTDITSISIAVSTGTLTPTDLNWKTLQWLSYSNGLNTIYTTDTSTKLKVWEKIYAKTNYSLTDVGVSNGTTAPTKAYLQEAPDVTGIAFNSLRLYTSSNVNPTDLTVTPTWVERQPLGNVDINRTASATDVTGQKMYVCWATTNIWKSANGGINWTEIPSISSLWPITDTITQSVSWASTLSGWIRITTLKPCILKTVNRASWTSCDRCRLFDSGYNLLATGSVASDTATFNYSLATTTTYIIEWDASWGTYNTASDWWWTTVPVAKSNYTLVSWSQSWWNVGFIRNLSSIVTEANIDAFDNLSCSSDWTKVIASKKNWRIYVSSDSWATWSETIPQWTWSTTDATWCTYSTFSSTTKYWMYCHAKDNIMIKTVEFDAWCTATTAYIYATNLSTILATATITSKIATFNYTVTNWQVFWIIADSWWGTYNVARQLWVTYDINWTNLYYSAGIDNLNQTVTVAYNVKNIVTALASNADRRISKISGDGSTYLAWAYWGRLYTSTNGSSWTERQPINNNNFNWTAWWLNYNWTNMLASLTTNGWWVATQLRKSTDSWANRTELTAFSNIALWQICASNDMSNIYASYANGVYVEYSNDFWVTRAETNVTDMTSWISCSFNWEIVSVSTAKRIKKSINWWATFTERQPAGNVDKAWNWIVLSPWAIPLQEVSVAASKATFSTTLVAGKYYNILFDKQWSSWNARYKATTFPATKTDINYLYGMIPYRDATNWRVITSMGSSVVNAISHPMVTSNGILYLWDGNFLAMIDQFGLYTPDKLTLPELDKIYDITYNNSYLRIYCDQWTNRDTGIAYFWDGIQDAPDQKQSLPWKYRCSTVKDNVDYAIMWFDPVLYYYPYQRQTLKRIYNLSTWIYGMINFQNYLMFGTLGWVYSRGNYNKDYPEVLNIEYKTSNLNDTDEIGSIFNANGDLYVAWKNWSTYGIDMLNTSVYATKWRITGRVYAGAQMWHNKNVVEVYLTHEPLITGQSINIYTRRNLSGSWTLQTTFDSTNGAVTHNKINFPLNFNELEMKLELIWPWTSTPEIYECLVRVEEQAS